MKKRMILLPILGIVFYLLYINGYLIINAKRAVMFVGKIGGNGRCKATFSSCDGYIKRAVRFKESRRYDFALDCELTTGELTVELLDSTRRRILSLNGNQTSASIVADQKKRYYMVFRFKSASGRYELKWH